MLTRRDMLVGSAAALAAGSIDGSTQSSLKTVPSRRACASSMCMRIGIRRSGSR